MDNKRIENAVRELLIAIGENPDREGLVKTPARVAKMYEELFSSYDCAEQDFSEAVFSEDTCGEFVLVKDIGFNSVCEHHVVPFFGRFHIAYVPKGRVLGLSKFGRIVDFYAKRLQLQERLTSQVADKINATVDNDGIAILCEAEHLCMTIRGIKKAGTQTVTTYFSGVFKDNPALQQLFFNSIRR